MIEIILILINKRFHTKINEKLKIIFIKKKVILYKWCLDDKILDDSDILY